MKIPFYRISAYFWKLPLCGTENGNYRYAQNLGISQIWRYCTFWGNAQIWGLGVFPKFGNTSNRPPVVYADFKVGPLQCFSKSLPGLGPVIFRLKTTTLGRLNPPKTLKIHIWRYCTFWVEIGITAIRGFGKFHLFPTYCK